MQDENYKKEVKQIYQNYAPHNVKAFSAGDKGYMPRLWAICQKINAAIKLPLKGNMLDIGCAHGECLAYFNQIKPDWDLYGVDIGEHFRDIVLKKKQVKAFFSNIYEVKASNIKFDFIMINYVLGVCDNIMDILDSLHNILSDNGIVFVIDTDFTVQPYLLNIIEQMSFFNKYSLEALLNRVGLEIINTDFKHEEKEIWAFAKKGFDYKYDNLYEINHKQYRGCLDYLNGVIFAIEEIVIQNRVIGIFGTSNAGIWVSEIVRQHLKEEDKIFFVDEDEEAVTCKISANGLPIYHVEDISEEAIILLPFPNYIANYIKERYERKYPNLKFIIFDSTR